VNEIDPAPGAIAVLTALSLTLAFTIFVRDRRNDDRQQADLVGIWATPRFDHVAPWKRPRIDDVTIDLIVRNASELPVEVVQVACNISTRWAVPDYASWRKDDEGQPTFPGVWSIKEGISDDRFYIEPGRVPPQNSWTHSGEFNIEHIAPQNDCQLDLIRGVTCNVSWALVVDNAGRRWELRPGRGGRAKRIRWYSRRREHQPRQW